MIFDLNNYIDPIKPRIYICRPNREIIGEINEAFSIQRNTKLGNVFDLTYRMPFFLDSRMKYKENPNIQFIKNRFLIKFVQGNVTEWYIIKNPQDTMDESTDFKTVSAYLLAYQLTDKNIRNYTATSINATAALTVALADTNWTIGNVDASFDNLYRSFNVTNSNVLDFVFQIATTFNALVDFDTVTRKINFKIFINYGTNKGLEVSYGNLLKSANQVVNTDEFYTRLKVFGANGISIQGQNSVGSNYIEDYSWFLQGYQEDVNGNVIGHSSEGMSDSLCKALITYRNKVTASNTTNQTYLTQLTGYQTTLTSQQNTLQTYKNELALIEDQISSANYTGASTTTLVTQKNAKNAQIASQNTAIATNQSNINSVNANITTLQNTLSITSNFTNTQITEWNDYIIVGTFENTNVSDSKQLYDLAVAEFEKLKQPKIVVNISIVNFLECVEEQSRWGMLNLGDTITIKNAKIGINVQAKIIEMNFDYESGDVSLVISNVKELLSDEARFLRDLYRANTTSSTVSNNDYKWDKAYGDVNDVNIILNNKWDATAREISASFDNTVSISRKGMITSSASAPNDMVIIQGGRIAISDTGGNSVAVAIDKTGVYAQRLVGQILAGVNLTITNSAGNFLVNQNGVTISGLALTITGGLPDGQITSSTAWNNAITTANNSVQKGTSYNGVVISSASGIQVIDSSVKTLTTLNATNGITIAKNNGTSGSPIWNNVLYADINGNITVDGIIKARDLQINGTSILNGNQISGNYIDSISANKISAGTITGVTISGNTINGGLINGTTIYGSNIIGGSITSNTTIDVGTNLFVGDNINLSRGSSGTQSIVSAGNGSIQFRSNGMTISANVQIDLSSNFVSYNGLKIATESYVDQQFAARGL